MAVVTTTGRVKYLKIGDDFCFVSLIEDGTGDTELFILWFFPDGQFSRSRLLEGMQLALLKESLVRDLTVRINHDEGSALIIQVRVDAAAAP